jgi:hypothetical protein
MRSIDFSSTQEAPHESARCADCKRRVLRHPFLHREGPCPRDCTVCGKQCVSPLFILSKSRMRKRARTDLRGGRSAMVVPTATVTPLAG